VAGAGAAPLIDAAEGGTLFFEEISDVPDALQSRLLNVIESGK
jgi:transcriptional regulator with PAS, ATPase and Fis domain